MPPPLYPTSPLSRVSASAPLDVEDPPAETAAPGRIALSYELFPPRSAAQAERLADTLDQLAATAPDFVSVTYGAAGSRNPATLDLLRHLVTRTSLKPVAHLTCVGSTEDELAEVVNTFLDIGVRGILAIRGDLPRGFTWPELGGPRYAHELVRLVRRVESARVAQLAAGRLSVGVAAYPSGHPDSPTRRHDVDVLLAKQRAGADFAITQLFFDPGHYVSLVREARRAGVRIPIIPGIMPLTSLRRIARMAELSQLAPPAELCARLEAAGTDAERMRIGVAATVELIGRARDAGAPGVHLYTFNDHRAALEVLDHLPPP